ncbi:unnamed protein product, partial [Tilletia laevis]
GLKSGVGKGYAADLHYVEACTRRIAAVATSSNTSSRSQQSLAGPILEANSREGLRFDILSNPEFLAEVTAISVLKHPDRVLIGSLRHPPFHSQHAFPQPSPPPHPP